MVNSKKLICISKEPNRVKVDLGTPYNYLVPLFSCIMNGGGQGCSPLTLGWEKYYLWTGKGA